MKSRSRWRRRLWRAVGIPAALSLTATVVVVPTAVLTAVPAAADTTAVPQQVTVDNVQLTVTTKDFPAASFTASQPGDQLQGADATVDSPTFARFSIIGVPFGYDDVEDDPALGAAATGLAATWQQTLAGDWAAQGATTQTGPVATLFGQQVTGTLIQPTIAADGITPRQVDMVQWVVEAGGRLWVVKDVEDHTADTAVFADDVVISSPNVNVATSIGTGADTGASASTSPDQSYAISNAMSLAASTDAASGETSSLPALPRPSWWKGSGPCDSGNSTSRYPNFALHYSSGGTTVIPSFRGMTACGPTRRDRKAVGDSEPTVSIGGFGEYEWECVELSQRYLYLAGYTSGGYGAMGNTVVDHYSGTRMTKVQNKAVPGVVPVAGDVVSMNHSDYAGHTAVVIGSNVDSSGNGTVTVLQNNWDDSGVGTMPVKGWRVYAENNWGGTDVNWLHDPNNSGGSGPPPAAPGVALGGVSDGQQNVTGTLTLTANPTMAVDGIYYHIVNQTTGYDTVSREIFGGTPYSYTVNTLNLPNGAYKVYATAPLSGHPTGISRQISFTINNNPIPAPPVVHVPGGVLTGRVTFTASASGTTSVTYFVDGRPLQPSSTNAATAFAYTWDSSSVPDGTHMITATAGNAGGSSPVSAAVGVEVWNGMLVQLHTDGTLWKYSGTPMTGWAKIDTDLGTTQVVSTNAAIYQLHSDGTMWASDGTPNNWTQIDNDPGTTQIAAGAAGLFQVHADGTVWAYNGAPNSWAKIDTNASVASLAVGNNVYELHKDGTIWSYTGTPGTWTPLDNNSLTSEIAAGGNNLYQLHSDGTMWTYNGAPNSWTQIDTDLGTTDIKVDGNGTLYQLHKDGTIWSYNGTPGGWTKLDNNTNAIGIQVGANGKVYEIHNDHSVWLYTGTPMTGWTRIDNDAGTTTVTGGETSSASWTVSPLYQRHSDGTMWQYTGTPLTGWTKIDTDSGTTQMASSGSALYQLHSDGTMYAYNGDPGTGWANIDTDAGTTQIAAGNAGLYQLHADGTMWSYNGSPASWTKIDTDQGTVGMAVADKAYQLHKDGTIWSYDGTPNSWTRLDNNAATIEIAAGGNNLYQLHSDGTMWAYSGTPGTWTQIDTDLGTTDIKVDGNGELYQLHQDGTIWSYNGTPNSWTKLDNNTNATAIQTGSDGKLYEIHNDHSIWVYTGTPQTGWTNVSADPGTTLVTAGESSSVHM